jgi:hypothetical protein
VRGEEMNNMLSIIALSLAVGVTGAGIKQAHQNGCLEARIERLENRATAAQERHFTRTIDTTYYLRSGGRDTVIYVHYR